jgi:hypothetical protein
MNNIWLAIVIRWWNISSIATNLNNIVNSSYDTIYGVLKWQRLWHGSCCCCVGETGLTLVEIQHNGSKRELAVTSLISLQNNLIVEIIWFNQFLLN